MSVPHQYPSKTEVVEVGHKSWKDCEKLLWGDEYWGFHFKTRSYPKTIVAQKLFKKSKNLGPACQHKILSGPDLLVRRNSIHHWEKSINQQINQLKHQSMGVVGIFC